jgi:outer membrane protein assembly factor BamB
MVNLHDVTTERSIRLWPGVTAGALIVLFLLSGRAVSPDAMFFGLPLPVIGLLGSVVAAFTVILWWLFGSRVSWSERLGALALMVLAIVLTRPLLDESIAGAGMGLMYYFFAIQTVSLAFVVWAVATRRLPAGARRSTMVLAVAIGCAVWTLARTDGVRGTGGSDFRWRWTPTPEERLLAQPVEPPSAVPLARNADAPLDTAAAPTAAGTASRPESPAAAATTKTPADRPVPESGARGTPEAHAAGATPTPEGASGAAASERMDGRGRVEGLAMNEREHTRARVEWPGFRGPNRDSVIGGVRINADWSSAPPRQLWRRAVGPGWSSFAVDGDVFYTQEQRGEEELITAYRVSTGEPVWRHRDAVRFYESNGGAGPRATPTLHDGRVYALGATGLLNALDARTGKVVWSRNVAADTKREIPDWGLSSSPLVVGDVVVAAASGHLAAYDSATGAPRWFGPTGGGGYSSPHVGVIDGVTQILLMRGSRTISLAPDNGALLWDHTWQPSTAIVQPAFTEEGDVLIASGDVMGGLGIRRLHVSHGGEAWSVEERWTSRGLKPYFNDFVVHKGHAYGFDGGILSCIDLTDGSRKWKGGRYGHGQLVLLADQDALLVLSEDGDLALVGATPGQYRELAKVSALNGKTWNHPVLVGDVLLARNGEEMVGFKLRIEN